MMAYLLRQCRRFLEEEISPVDFQEQLDRLFLARRTALEDDPQGGIPSNERAIQVLNLVDSADYLVDGEAGPEVQGMFREAYEWLSEFCHPNLQARAGEHDTNGPELVFLRTPRLKEGDIGMTLSHLRL